MYTYPPKCSKPYEQYLTQFPSDCIYVSTPMTTGKRYFEALKSGKPFNREDILKQNADRARFLEKKLKGARKTRTIINPAEHKFEGFGPDDYLGFWVEVIKSKCEILYFVDNWEYSSGSAYEFLQAQSKNIPCYTESMMFMHDYDGLNKIKKAVEEWRPYIDTSFLQSVAHDLTCLVHGV